MYWIEVMKKISSSKKYDFIEEIIQEVLVNKDKEARSTDRIDAVLTDNVWGYSNFLDYYGIYFLLNFYYR